MRRVTVPGPLPGDVHGVISQRLFIEKADLPSALLNQIKRVAAFQNPEFYKRSKTCSANTASPSP